MSAAVQLDADRMWTFRDLDSLPDELAKRCEIVDGVLIVSPSAGRRHESAVLRLGSVLLAAVPPGWDVIAAAGIDLAPTYRVTDVTVIADRAYRLAENVATPPGDVVIAIEIESPSSVTTDRITKPVEYARAGIPHYWRLVTDPLRLYTYTLTDAGYASAGEWGADETARIIDPFPVRIDLSMLLPG